MSLGGAKKNVAKQYSEVCEIKYENCFVKLGIVWFALEQDFFPACQKIE